MARPSFLSNKHTACDFCGSDFVGNINQANLFMCDKCVRFLCGVSDEKKIKYLSKFKGEKEKEKVILRFINEEVLNAGSEVGKYNPGMAASGVFGAKADKVRSFKTGIFMDKRRPEAP